jgi:fucose 4-O-acetylase-like acetyltransferase
MNNTVKKLTAISRLKGLAIILVVLGHSLPITTDDYKPFSAELLTRFIYSFHMPLFMCISGFLFVYTNKDREITHLSFLYKKARRLLLPYISISTFAFLIKSGLSRFAMRPVDFSFQDYIHSIFYPADNAIIYYWFIFALFVIFVISPVIIFLLRKGMLISVLGLIACMALALLRPVKIELFCLHMISTQLLYFYLGAFLCYYFENKLESCKRIQFVLIPFVLLAINAFFTVEMDFWLPIIPALLGIWMMFSLAFVLENISLMPLIERYCYQIYLLSWFPMVVFNILFRMGKLPFIVASLAMLISGLFLPVLVSRIVAKRIAKLKPFIGM